MAEIHRYASLCKIHHTCTCNFAALQDPSLQVETDEDFSYIKNILGPVVTSLLFEDCLEPDTMLATRDMRQMLFRSSQSACTMYWATTACAYQETD